MQAALDQGAAGGIGTRRQAWGVRRVERQDQKHNGEEYAAYREDPKERQHVPACITESD